VAPLAFFANPAHRCSFQGCISYTNIPDFIARSFATIPFASASSETSSKTAPFSSANRQRRLPPYASQSSTISPSIS